MTNVLTMIGNYYRILKATDPYLMALNCFTSVKFDIYSFQKNSFLLRGSYSYKKTIRNLSIHYSAVVLR